MRRIGLVVVLVLSFLVPLGAEGQQTEKVRRIGFLSAATPNDPRSKMVFGKVSASTATSRARTCSLKGDLQRAGMIGFLVSPRSSSD